MRSREDRRAGDHRVSSNELDAIRCDVCGQRRINGRCLACESAARVRAEEASAPEPQRGWWLRSSEPQDPENWLARRVALGEPVSWDIAWDRFGAEGGAAWDAAVWWGLVEGWRERLGEVEPEGNKARRDERARELYRAGWTYSAIAQELGVSRGSVYNALQNGVAS